jgi:PAS domain-containing protein
MLEIESLKETNLQETKKMLDLLEKNKTDIIEILNAIPAKIFLKDSNGYMVLCNNAVAQSYNLPIHKLIGTHDKDHFDQEQAKLWREQELEIMRMGGKTFLQEERLNGKLRYLKTTKMPFFISHLNETGLLGYQFDVTDSYEKESNN